MWQLIAGPLFGLIGSGVEKFFEHKEEERKAKERALDRQHDLDTIKLETEMGERQLRLETDTTIQKIDAKAFKDNYKSANKSLFPKGQELTPKQLTWVVAVEVFCKAIRPASTVFYQIMVAAVFGWAAYNVVQAGGGVFTTDEFAEMFKHLVYSMIGIAETSLFWWFGIRRMSKRKDGSLTPT